MKQVGDLQAFLGDLHAVSLHTQSAPDASKVILRPNVPRASITHLHGEQGSSTGRWREDASKRGAAASRALFKGGFVREETEEAD